ncbi:MAG: hypothetical protein HQL03_05615 [Nitrospirae bacterium]|nr:hypothetical protein [Nitrospirota bacterium]
MSKKLRERLSVIVFVLSLIVCLPISAYPDALDNWHWRNPLPTGNNLLSVSYGNNTFVAVGANGTILTSPGGVAWTTRTSGTSYDLAGVIYGRNTFVAVGYSGTILTSSDGVTWVARNSGTSYALFGVSYGNNTFVAVGDSGTILISSDGVTWVARTSGTHNNLNGVIYGNNTFVAVGDSGTILTSPDSVTWIARTSGTSYALYGVIYGNNMFVAVGGSHVIIAHSGVYSSTIQTSPDGITWTTRTSGTPNVLTGVSYGNNSFVAVGFGYTSAMSGSITSYNTILTSVDGVTWTTRTSGTSNVLTGVSYGNNTFVAVGGIYNSADLAYDDGAIMTSPDGVTWTTRTSIKSNKLNAVSYVNNTFVAVGEGGTMLTSPDGVTWRTRTSGTSNSLSGVSYGNNTFVAVGDNGTILQSDSTVQIQITSPNGGEIWPVASNQTITWTASNLTPNGYLYLIYYDGSAWQYIAWLSPPSTSYTWQVPNTPTSGAYIWIGSWANNKWEAYDISDGAFTITGSATIPAIKITSPNGGETWQVGSAQTIRWQLANLTPSGYLYLFYYDGSAWQYIAWLSPNSTSYTWQVPNTPTSGAYIWIGSWANNKWEAYDISDGAFTISGNQ